MTTGSCHCDGFPFKTRAGFARLCAFAHGNNMGLVTRWLSQRFPKAMSRVYSIVLETEVLRSNKTGQCH